MSKINLTFWIKAALLIAIIGQSCTRFNLTDYNIDPLTNKKPSALKNYADTSLVLEMIKNLPNDKQRIDTLIFYAEWIKNYKEDISLLYAQKAYDIATDRNWNIPRIVSTNRIAWLKGRKAKFGEGIEDAMVDAKISRRLLRDYEHPYWEFDMNYLMGYLFMRDEFMQNKQMDSSKHYFEIAFQQLEHLKTDERIVNWNKALILHNLALIDTNALTKEAFFHQSDSLFQLYEQETKEYRARLWRDWGYFYRTRARFFEADSLFDLCIEYGNSNNDNDILAQTHLRKGDLYSTKFRSSRDKNDFLIARENLNKSLGFSTEDKYQVYDQLGTVFHLGLSYEIDNIHIGSAISYYKQAMEEAQKEGAIRTLGYIAQKVPLLNNSAPAVSKQVFNGESFEGFVNRIYLGAIEVINNRNKNAYRRINKVEQRDIQVRAAAKEKNQWLISITIFLIAFMIFLFMYQRQQNRRLKAQMEALRAQINPHFMSNSLNAIESLVNMGKTKDASKYLVHFSRLTRQILMGSRTSIISLKDELSTLRHFLALEQLRFRDKLTYDIQINPDVKKELVAIPAMTLQPYIENAIWHGIKPKVEGGHIQINIKKEGKILICSIEDNGIGREKAKALQKASVMKRKSVGMKITEDRLRAMGRIKGSQVEIQDLKDLDGKALGTKVILRLPYRLRKS